MRISNSNFLILAVKLTTVEFVLMIRKAFTHTHIYILT
jgi:hypothetical protein